MGSFYPYFAPIYIAQQEGYYADQGLTVHLENNLGNAHDAMAAMLGGSVQITAPGGTTVLASASKGADITSIFTLGYGTTDQLILNRADAIKAHIPVNGSITAQLAAMKGSNMTLAFASAASDPTIEVRELLASAGVSIGSAAGDVHFVYAGNQPNAVALVKAGKAQGYAGTPPTTFDLPASQIVRIAYGNSPQFEQTFFRHVITTTAYIHSHPAILKAFAIGTARAWALMVQHPTQAEPAFAAMLKEVYGPSVAGITKPALVNELYSNELSVIKAQPTTPALTATGYNRSITLLNNMYKYENPPVPAVHPSMSQLVDNTFVNEAITSLHLDVPTGP